MFKKILIVIVVILIVIQFFRIDRSVPETNPSDDLISITTPPAEVADMLKNACYDCHSYETKYPWYAEVAPVSWFLRSDIKEARKHMNFSIWGKYSQTKQMDKLRECYEHVSEKEMPLWSYTLMHSKADLSDSQRKILDDWFQSVGGFKGSDVDDGD